MTESAREILRSHSWKNGNIRELRNCLRAMTEMAVDGLLTPLGIPKTFWDTVEGRDEHRGETSPARDSQRGSGLSDGRSETVQLQLAGQTYDKLCQELLLAMLQQAFAKQGKLSLRQFSRLSGIAKSTLTTRLRDLVDGGLISLRDMQSMVGVGRDDSRDDGRGEEDSGV
jgi:DNA-binding NtrC family response regulator